MSEPYLLQIFEHKNREDPARNRQPHGVHCRDGNFTVSGVMGFSGFEGLGFSGSGVLR